MALTLRYRATQGSNPTELPSASPNDTPPSVTVVLGTATSEPSTHSADPRDPFTYAQQATPTCALRRSTAQFLLCSTSGRFRFSNYITVLRSAVARVKGLHSGEPQDSRLSACNSILTTALTRPVGRRHSCSWPAGDTHSAAEKNRQWLTLLSGTALSLPSSLR